MRSPAQAYCEKALRSYETPLRAAVAHDYPETLRMQAKEELVRKAWQVVLCLRWESNHCREHLEQPARMTSSEPDARSEGTA